MSDVEEIEDKDIKNIAVAVNPQAAFGANPGAGNQVVALLRAAGHRPQLLNAGSYAQLAANVAAVLDERRADALLMVGGDGMVHLGVNALAGSEVPLGLVPAGTGNDAARSWGLPLGDVPGAVEHFLRSSLAPRKVDLGVARTEGGEHYFAAALSAGFDAVVNERANAWHWPKGRSRYNLAIVRELATFRPISYRLTVDGVDEEVEAMLVAVANGQSFGGGMKIAPEAQIDDGELDLFMVAPVSRVKLITLFPKVFSGRHTGHPAVSIRRVRSVRIEGLESSRPITGYADGERLGGLPAEVEIAPRALTLWG